MGSDPPNVRMRRGRRRRPAGLVAALAAAAFVTVVSNCGGPPVLGYEIKGSPERSTVHLHTSEDFNWLLALQARKLLYCSIQKVASAEWKRLLRWVQGDPNWRDSPHSTLGYHFLETMPLEQANDLLKEHFKPQYCHCSLGKTAHLFDIVGFGERMARDAVSVFKETGVFSGGDVAPEGDGWGTPPPEEEVLQFLMDEIGTDHDDACKQRGTAKEMDVFYTPELKEAVRNAFHVDFDLFSCYWADEME